MSYGFNTRYATPYHYQMDPRVNQRWQTPPYNLYHTNAPNLYGPSYHYPATLNQSGYVESHKAQNMWGVNQQNAFYPTQSYNRSYSYPYQPDILYSDPTKAFNSSVPYNTQTLPYMPVSGIFKPRRLDQTDVLYVPPPAQQPFFGEVPLAPVVSKNICNMGAITTHTGENLGTCTLISENLVLVARHTIEGKDIRGLYANFGYHLQYDGSLHICEQAWFDYVVEDDQECDYAIVKLKTAVKRNEYLKLSISDDPIAELALLHYPIGKPLKVSVHAILQSHYYSHYLNTFHDTDYFSSGGAYLDPLGHLTALHLGSQLDGDRVNVSRYAITLKRIVERNPHSILLQLTNGRLSQSVSYKWDQHQHFLELGTQPFLMDEEGYQSKKILTNLLKNIHDPHIQKNKGGVALSATNLDYIQAHYPIKFKQFEKQCLFIAGTHKTTKQFSVVGYIESDHVIPHDVWKSTTNPKMKKLVKGSGTRPGENEMPAITIPYDKHRDLLTTGSSPQSVNFRKSLVTLCNQGKVDQALTRCFQEYRKNGISLKAHKPQIIASLDAHVTVGVITKSQKNGILSTLNI